MSERAYRQRLEADLARWQADGLLPTSSADAIRATLRPIAEGITIATVVGIVGSLLIAAAFLAFVAANWTAIARPARFAMLLAGIAGAYGVGAWFDRTGRTHLADLAVGVGTIIFGAAVALVGQMYHLGDDFAGGMLLWAGGALAAAALTGSRAALAVALAAACVWSGMRVSETFSVHLPYLAFWLGCSGLALAWNAPVARHLVALAAVAGAALVGMGVEHVMSANAAFTVTAAVSILVGAGLLMATQANESVRRFGLTLSSYGAFALVIGLSFTVADLMGQMRGDVPAWVVAAGAAGALLAFAASGISRRLGPALAGVSVVLALVVVSGAIRTNAANEPWLAYALTLSAMLSLVVSGMIDDVRPRVIAGWIGVAAAIAAITWAVPGSLLRRAMFLAAAGLVAVALASLLGRFRGREGRR